MEIDNRHSVELVLQRMVYALLAEDPDAYRLAVDEFDDCPQCFRNVLYEVTRLYVGQSILLAGGRERAVEATMEELERILMPDESNG
ncbi:hypothetical protein [Mycobacterium malmoense]|uniref:hypothetical protein n=1 Tax=Mycobacterium malmoense TaxID=1780 RepID=UPI001146D3F3|nr:hypothetical protein [Mycobacterium malmoense]